MTCQSRVLLLFCASLLSACSRDPADDATFKRISLPGFSIEVLEGKVTSTSDSHSEGRHVIKFPDPTFVERTFKKVLAGSSMTIEWSSLSYSHEEWKTMILPALLGALEGKVIQGARLLKEAEAGKDRWVYVLGTPQAPIGAGVVNCDSEFSVSITFARYKDIERQFAELDRIVKSVQCEVTDANRARPIAATRLPRKFGQTPDRDIQIFQALDGEQLMINFTQTDVQRNPFLYRQIMRSMLVNSIGIEFPEKDLKTLSPGSPSPAGKSSLMRLDFPATNETLYIGTQFCPEIDLSLISMWTAPGASDQLARERQSQVGCPGEESSATPTFASIADAACAAGEKQFCGLREMPE